MGSETAPTPLTAEEMAARRLALADRWDRKWPHTPFEMGGAAERDARIDFNVVEPFVCDYDRRVLLNVVAALMDDLDAARREQAGMRGPVAVGDGLRAALDALCYAAEDVILQRSGQWRTSGKALSRLEEVTKAGRAALDAYLTRAQEALDDR